MQQVTLRDIAKKSGFSVTTVSRALGGYDDVNEKTRAHIVKIANELGYQPNLIARQLQGQRTFTLGMIVPAKMDGEDDFFSILIKGVGHAAAAYHYDLLISTQLSESDERDAYRRIVGGNRVDGIVVARTYHDDPRIDYLQANNHPFVVFGRSAPEQPSDFLYIDVDSQAGIRMLVEHFVEYGHEHIGVILPPEGIAFTPYRFAGYRDGLKDAGLPYRPEYVISGDLKSRSGYQAANTLLDQAPQITAIVACNDLMALGVMRAVQERGLQIGHDIAIGGYDDIPAAEHAVPSLTTISIPIYDIGEQLTDLLLKNVGGEPITEKGTLLTPTLVIRDSSGHPRH